MWHGYIEQNSHINDIISYPLQSKKSLVIFSCPQPFLEILISVLWSFAWLGHQLLICYGLPSYLWATSLLNSIVCNFYEQKWSILSFLQAIFSYWIDIDEIFWVSKRYGYRYDIDIMIPSQYWYGYDIISKFCQRFDMIFISKNLGYLTSLIRSTCYIYCLVNRHATYRSVMWSYIGNKPTQVYQIQ